MFSLARELKLDIDVIRNWPYRKFNEWLVYFTVMDRRKDDGNG